MPPLDSKLQAALRAPIGSHILRPDSQVNERPGWYQVFTPSSQTSTVNEIVYSSNSPEEIEAVVDRELVRAKAHRVPLKWCTGHWTEPTGLGEILTRRGFGSWEARGMVAVVSKTQIPTPHDVQVEKVNESNFDDYFAATLRGWDISEKEALDLRAATQAAMDRFHFYLAYMQGQVAGTAGLIIQPDSGYLTGGVVLPGFRHKGVYRALLARRIQDIASHGHELATTHARGATSAPILEKLEFETVFQSRIYLITPQDYSRRTL